MMGTGTFAEPTFEALLASRHPVVGLVTQPDRPAGQERGSTRQTGRGMAAIAREHDVPFFQPESVNTPEGVAGLRAFRPDLVAVAAYGQILSAEVLGVPAHGGVNVHASLLPKYRGAAPVAWSIYHGETRSGVTIIRMTTGLDAGDILAQEELDIDPDETAGELEVRLAPVGARLAVGVIDQFESGTARGRPQDKAQATRAPKLTKEHGRIDWGQSPEQVRNQVRAMQPWPTAYTYLRRAGQPQLRVIVSRVRVAEGSASAVPGSTLGAADSARLIVAAGNGVVEVLELQPAGKRRMTGAEFLRGYPLRAGDRFGPETP
jgi:methionyl-tRNA formyltransferase